MLLAIPAHAAGALPSIDSFTPERGKENGNLLIKGEGFGNRNAFINPNYYVNFNGFLGTEILQWNDTIIEIKIPRLGAVASEQKETATDIISWIPIVKNIAKIPLKLMPIRVAKAPEEAGTRATITVVTPSGESNEAHFFYEHEESVEKTNYIWDTAKLIGETFFEEYIEKPFNTILHPIQTLQNKTERLTRMINGSIVLPLGDSKETPNQISKPLFENSDKASEAQPKQKQPPDTEVSKDSGQPPALQWKTIDKPTFTIKIPESWKETAPHFGGQSANGFRFEGSGGEYFEIAIDPPPVGLPRSDQNWELDINTSGDGVVIKNIDDTSTEGETRPSKGNNKLEIDAYADDSDSQNIPLQGHHYFFFFGNDQKETGVDTEIFKAILNSFRAKQV